MKAWTLVDIASPSSFHGGTCMVASPSTPMALVSSMTPCGFVWIGARFDNNGAPLNTHPCFLGDAATQNIPVMPGNAEGLMIRIDDASKIFVRAGDANQGVSYRIFA